MSTSLRLAAFAAGVAVVFLLAFAVGRAVGPWSPEPAHIPSPTQGESPEDGHSEGQAPHPKEASHDD